MTYSPSLVTTGAVAGNDFPLRVNPMVPASLSIMGSSWATFTPGGTGSWPMRNAPARPFGTWVTAFWWEWYIPTAGPLAVNS